MTTLPNNVSTSPPAESAAGAEVLRLEFRRNMGQISRHSLMFFAGTIFTMGAGYLIKVYVARVLGAELLGIYALGMTLVSLAQLLGCLGLNGAAARYVAVYNATGRYGDLRGFLTRPPAGREETGRASIERKKPLLISAVSGHNVELLVRKLWTALQAVTEPRGD